MYTIDYFIIILYWYYKDLNFNAKLSDEFIIVFKERYLEKLFTYAMLCIKYN